MKKYLLLLLLLPAIAYAGITTVPWLRNSAGPYLYTPYSSDKVGIGTTTPQASLEIGPGGNQIIDSTLGVEQGPDFATTSWTLTAGWESTNDSNTQLDKNADGVTTATQTGGGTVVVGTVYKVVITTNVSIGSGFTWTFGGVSAFPITATGTYTQYIRAITTSKAVFTPTPTTTRFIITNISIKPVTNATTGTIMAEGDIMTGGLFRNPAGTVGLNIDPNGTSRFGGNLAIAGTFTGATSGAFSSAITNTNNSLVMGTAAGTVGSLIEVNGTAATAVAPIQISPAVEWRGNVWDTASRSHNWRTYSNPMFDSTIATARLVTQYGYNGVTQAIQTDRMSLGSEGTLDVFGTTLGNESMTNGALTSGTSWTRTGDMALTANTAVYTHSSGVGTLSQASTSLATVGVANRWYQFSYVMATVTTGVTCYINPTFSQKRIYLNLVAGTYLVTFKANSAPGDFTITCTSTAGAATFDTFSLKEIQSGDIIANGQFTGGGTTGIKITGTGNVGIGTTTPTSLLAIASSTATSTLTIGAKGFPGRIILYDEPAGGACTQITTSAGTVTGAVVTCP